MGKRSNGAGYYKRLKSGTWLGQIMDNYTDDGKKRVISFTAPTKSEAQQKVMQYLSDRDASKLILKKETPFDRWAEYWYQDYQSQVQPSTYRRVQIYLKAADRLFSV